MGLAFGTIAATGATLFWEVLSQASPLETPEMSFWITGFLNDQNFGGTFTQDHPISWQCRVRLPLVTGARRETY